MRLSANDNKTKREADIASARKYLETGGLGEVVGFTDLALQAGQLKVQSDADMVMALCLMAADAIELKRELYLVKNERDNLRDALHAADGNVQQQDQVP
jgi:hypothetical protein